MKLQKINIKSFTVKLLLMTQIIIFDGCKKTLDVNLPVDKITKETVYNNVGTAVLVLNGLYSSMANSSFALVNFTLNRSADDFKYMISANAAFLNAVPSDDGAYGPCWTNPYKDIYTCNSVIDGVSASSAIAEQDKKTLIGEAKFVRALYYFYLVNTFGAVPLATTTDFKINSKLARSSTEEVYQLIEKDLLDAKANLSADYLATDLRTMTTERVRPTRWAATAMLARMYLYTGQWQKAESEATELINNNGLFDTVPLNEVYKKNSRETIWALQPLNQTGAGQSNNTIEAMEYLPWPGLPPFNVLSDNLISAFDPGDQRKNEWVGMYTDNSVTPANILYYPNKYQIGRNTTSNPQNQQEYSIVLRIGEQYLIRAEARSRQQNLAGAKVDIDIIRQRAGLGGITLSTEENMLLSVLKERQTELFTEDGHRWFDLRRTGHIDEVMRVQTPVKGGGTWEPYKALYPIPYNEISLNPSLQGHQNPGWPERL